MKSTKTNHTTINIELSEEEATFLRFVFGALSSNKVIRILDAADYEEFTFNHNIEELHSSIYASLCEVHN